jgi:proline iminopeptidase
VQIEVNGTRLWFDVDGCSLVPDGPVMRRRPTIVLVHGGPGGYDHTYFKPYFSQLAEHMQVVYLDLRDHGRSGRHDPAQWSFEVCADDVRAFCDAIGIDRPVVFGHSLGGFVTTLYGARHPGHAAGLILQSTMARFDLQRLADGFCAVAGDEVGELARRDFGGDPVTEAESAQVFAAFGPNIPDAECLARRMSNPDVGEPGMELIRRLDVLDQLARITSPTLVCVGTLDPVTPVAAACEMVDALPPGLAQLEIMEGVGHFPWLDAPEEYLPLMAGFVNRTAQQPAQSPTG